jgi:CSLREA domain-containing protein
MNISLSRALIFSLVLIAAFPPLAHAATTFTVTATADNTTSSDGSCTLREAVLAANGSPVNTDCGADSGAPYTVNFATSGTITLSSKLYINCNMTIDGAGRSVTVSGNNAMGVFYVNGGRTLNLNKMTVTNGNNYSGGGIENYGTLNVSNCTISDNSAIYGGGIFNWGTSVLTNSTISGNNAKYSGGAIYNDFGNMTVINSTISSNTASPRGGIYKHNGSVTVTNSIIANSSSVGNCYNTDSLSSSNNLANDDSCGPGFTYTSTINLGPLGDYGGSTWTIPLLPGSAAIDAGRSDICADAATVNSLDQRGLPRPANRCDIGAFESQGFTMSKTDGDNQRAVINSAFAIPLGLTVTANNPSEPVNGGTVNFTAPSSLASTNPAAFTVIIGPNGDAFAKATANGTVGGPYSIVANAAGAANANFTLENVAGLATLTIDFAGNGSGTVTSTSPATPLISCIKGSPGGCSASYPLKTSVTLAATDNWRSLFGGWSGGVVSSANPVTFTMDNNKTISATFNPNFRVKLLPGNGLFAGIQDAYASVTSGNITILSQTHTYLEELLFNKGSNVILSGGMDGSFCPTEDYSTVNKLTVGGGQVVISKIAIKSLTVTSTPVFSTQPLTQSVNEGQTASFTVAAEGDPLPTYQWQRFVAGAWTDIPGATAPAYTTPPTVSSDNGAQFRCIASNGIGSLIPSNLALLEVNYINITTQAINRTIAVGQSATFTVAATGNPAPLSYQWYWRPPGPAPWMAIAGATAPSYTTPAAVLADNGKQYYCKITAGTYFKNCGYRTLNVKQAVIDRFSANGQTAGVSVNYGDTITLSALFRFNKGPAIIKPGNLLINNSGDSVTLMPTQDTAYTLSVENYLGEVVQSLPLQVNVNTGADLRYVVTGHNIPDENYVDQPYVVILNDGTWLCVLTTGNGGEGAVGQHIVATRSNDHGMTWTPLVDIEPANGSFVSSWAMPYLTPYGRVYVFYDFNGDDITSLPNGTHIINDLLGWYCFKFSDDGGLTWSKRYRIPINTSTCDLNNDWRGAVQLMWGVGKPITHNDAMYFGFTKLCKYPGYNGEGWFIKCDNINTETNPLMLNWVNLPEGNYGVRNADYGSTQEEHQIVSLSDGTLYTQCRTELGYLAGSYSMDNGNSWTPMGLVTYLPTGNQKIKNPRANPRIWKASNGKYIMWYHNHSGTNWSSRNPAWIAGGIEENGRIKWSQPEIVLYDTIVDDNSNGFSYPDFIDDGGSYWVTETNKYSARVHKNNSELLNGLWNQFNAVSKITDGLRLEVLSPANGSIENFGIVPNLSSGGFSVEIGLNIANLSSAEIILDQRDSGGNGFFIYVTSNATIGISISDGTNTATWECDSNLISVNKGHHIVFIVDGGPNIISVIVDGILCDGGEVRQYGWGRFSQKMSSFGGSSTITIGPSFNGAIKFLRIYDRYLRTSEAISNYRFSLISGQINN